MYHPSDPAWQWYGPRSWSSWGAWGGDSDKGPKNKRKQKGKRSEDDKDKKQAWYCSACGLGHTNRNLATCRGCKTQRLGSPAAVPSPPPGLAAAGSPPAAATAPKAAFPWAPPRVAALLAAIPPEPEAPSSPPQAATAAAPGPPAAPTQHGPQVISIGSDTDSATPELDQVKTAREALADVPGMEQVLQALDARLRGSKAEELKAMSGLRRDYDQACSCTVKQAAELDKKKEALEKAKAAVQAAQDAVDAQAAIVRQANAAKTEAFRRLQQHEAPEFGPDPAEDVAPSPPAPAQAGLQRLQHLQQVISQGPAAMGAAYEAFVASLPQGTQPPPADVWAWTQLSQQLGEIIAVQLPPVPAETHDQDMEETSADEARNVKRRSG